MYCVRCGVSLQDGVERCPLCGTPVWNPDELTFESRYNTGIVPDKTSDTKPAAIFLTVLTALAAVAMTVICLGMYGRLSWGDIVLASLLLFFIISVLPLWFSAPNPMIFLPVDLAAVELFLLFICLRTGGHWFMSFAFPCAGILGIIVIASTALLKYVRKGRYCVLGGAQIVLAAFCILLEFFQHITFDTGMFRWSLFASAGLFVSGAFMLCMGLIRPLREFVEKVFFM